MTLHYFGAKIWIPRYELTPHYPTLTETETEKLRKRREGCRFLVPGVPEAPSGGAEGGEEEVVGRLAEAEGDQQLKSDKLAKLNFSPRIALFIRS